MVSNDCHIRLIRVEQHRHAWRARYFFVYVAGWQKMLSSDCWVLDMSKHD